MPATSIDEGVEPPSGSAGADNSLRSFLEELLGEQQKLQTPVARFSDAHDRGAPALAQVYRDLMPLSRPGPGEQYAFEVELDSCTGCKACVSACHSLNGLDEGEVWRDVGCVSKMDSGQSVTLSITTACHHCADPACLNGCPVLAYEKDPVTGIVRHLDDQCIGCSYCILKCPYDAPKYNPSRGIIRKCDLCQGRLEHGEAPACVQGCPTHAIRVVTVPVQTGKTPAADTSDFLDEAFDPAYTLPTTRYLTKRDLAPASHARSKVASPSLEAPHWPLVIAVTLFSSGVGASVISAVTRPTSLVLPVFAWLAATSGIATSLFHLGQPQRAWRIFLGLRRSWLSRETVFFGFWWMAAGGAVWETWRHSGAFFTSIAAVLGAAGLFCSVMVYVDTRREFWRMSSTAPRFLGSAAVMGLSIWLASGAPRSVGLVVAAAIGIKMLFEARVLHNHRVGDDGGPLTRTAQLHSAVLAPVVDFRFVAGFAGGVLVPLLIFGQALPPPAAWVAFAVVSAGELAERYLFFRAVIAPRMPGTLPR